MYYARSTLCTVWSKTVQNLDFGLQESAADPLSVLCLSPSLRRFPRHSTPSYKRLTRSRNPKHYWKKTFTRFS
ncbi:hypothetical protein I7I50_05924 [Histoplasma capsulatum G186AR]|uniref:Uncharacterized protein n=1 Tax=Ajellomyces capsulatus TaxID=5037 RepID=A0A8H7ZAG4_AJECA|nr:hypothetical protein I7I52_04183 [Histoplasma capsulatum]QSS76463.1 hypothetical protein I7I50_05924 [Histoplasma capsulatum G186AR]